MLGLLVCFYPQAHFLSEQTDYCVNETPVSVRMNEFGGISIGIISSHWSRILEGSSRDYANKYHGQ